MGGKQTIKTSSWREDVFVRLQVLVVEDFGEIGLHLLDGLLWRQRNLAPCRSQMSTATKMVGN
jgi:hypothetical protein